MDTDRDADRSDRSSRPAHSRRFGLRSLLFLIAALAVLFSRAQVYGPPTLCHGLVFRLWLFDVDCYVVPPDGAAPGYYVGFVPAGGAR
jgi:4-hydroxybenzoate polyprenyltransferase